MLISVALGSLAQIPLKKSAVQSVNINRAYFLNFRTALGYSMMLIASLLSFWAIRQLDIKTAAIIETTAYLYILLIGYFVFKEKLTARKIIACALIICGIIVFTG